MYENRYTDFREEGLKLNKVKYFQIDLQIHWSCNIFLMELFSLTKKADSEILMEDKGPRIIKLFSKEGIRRDLLFHIWTVTISYSVQHCDIAALISTWTMKLEWQDQKSPFHDKWKQGEMMVHQ